VEQEPLFFPGLPRSPWDSCCSLFILFCSYSGLTMNRKDKNERTLIVLTSTLKKIIALNTYIIRQNISESSMFIVLQ
jgi:hypothetical protein